MGHPMRNLVVLLAGFALVAAGMILTVRWLTAPPGEYRTAAPDDSQQAALRVCQDAVVDRLGWRVDEFVEPGAIGWFNRAFVISASVNMRDSSRAIDWVCTARPTHGNTVWTVDVEFLDD